MPVIALFLSNLPALIKAGQGVAQFISDMKATLSQTAEWTEDQETQFQNTLMSEGVGPEWLPDPKV